MKKQIDAAIRKAKRQGTDPVELRLGRPLLDALVKDAPTAGGGLYRGLPLTLVENPEHASLKVLGGPHIAIKTT